MKGTFTVTQDQYGNARERVMIEQTSFIWLRNFQGDPRRDSKFGSSEQKCSVKIDADFYQELLAQNVGAKYWTKTCEDGSTREEYFVDIKLRFRNRDGSMKKRPPKVYLVPGPGAAPVLMPEESMKDIDDLAVNNVNVVAYTFQKDEHSAKTLWIDTIYIEQALDDDPFYSQYRSMGEPEEMPFV